MRFLAALVAATTLIATPVAASTPPGDTTPPITANPFLPESEEVANCLSALPPPSCGSEERGGVGQYLTFAAMALGLTFVGWRIARGIRRRDRAMSPGP